MADKSDAPDTTSRLRIYQRVDQRDLAAIQVEFSERMCVYKAIVERIEPTALPGAVTPACAFYGISKLVVPADLPAEWASQDVVTLRDKPLLTYEQFDQSDGVLTGCALTIAQTATVEDDGDPHQGRRALSLVPDRHLCVVYAEQLVGMFPEAFTRLAHMPTCPLTFISGPLATSDIELSRVEGGHGPRTLHVAPVEATEA